MEGTRYMIACHCLLEEPPTDPTAVVATAGCLYANRGDAVSENGIGGRRPSTTGWGQEEGKQQRWWWQGNVPGQCHKHMLSRWTAALISNRLL